MANGAFFRAQGQSQVKLRKVKALIPENEVFDYELDLKNQLIMLLSFKLTGIILLFGLLPFNLYCSDRHGNCNLLGMWWQ